MSRGWNVVRQKAGRAARRTGLGVAAGVLGVLAWATWSGYRMETRFADRLHAQSSASGPIAPDPSPGVPGPGTDGNPQPELATIHLRISGFNTWALPVWLPGMVKHDRLPLIPSALTELSVDVIALQEAFDVRFRRFTVRSLDTFQAGEDVLCEARMSPWGRKDCSGGLMTLSRYPIVSEQFYAHTPSPTYRWDEKKGGKGFMVTTIMTPVGNIDIANIHLYAGRAEGDETERMDQIRRFALLLEDRDVDRPVVIVADLNVVHPSLENPEAGLPPSRVYRFLVDSLGFVDTRPQVDESDFTYDRVTNRYANVWYNRFEGRQVFDYVMYRAPAPFQVSIQERTRVMDTPKPLSDHYGTFADLVIRKSDGGI